MPSPQSTPQTRLVTSEAVILDVYPAEFATRGLARLIDSIAIFFLQLVVIGSLLAGATALGLFEEWVYITVVIIFIFLIQYGYHLAFNVRSGTTPGKRLLGLQIINRDGGPASLRQYVARELVGLAEIQAFVGVPAILMSLYSPYAQRLGDLAANTLVVHTKPGPIYGTSKAINWILPQGMDHFLPGMDLTGLTGEDITVIRTFLLRAPKMRPQARDGVAKRLRDMVVQKCNLYLPTNVPDEVVLATVMAKLSRPSTLY